MKREIKFRAWDMPFGPKEPMQEMVHGKASSILAFAEMSPDKYIVEQFTGLTDENGKDIYEGDLVLLTNEYQDPIYIYEVVFDEAKFEISGDGGCYDLDEVFMNCEVIGNVHTNPELLEEDE